MLPEHRWAEDPFTLSLSSFPGQTVRPHPQDEWSIQEDWNTSHWNSQPAFCDYKPAQQGNKQKPHFSNNLIAEFSTSIETSNWFKVWFSISSARYMKMVYHLSCRKLRQSFYAIPHFILLPHKMWDKREAIKISSVRKALLHLGISYALWWGIYFLRKHLLCFPSSTY